MRALIAPTLFVSFTMALHGADSWSSIHSAALAEEAGSHDEHDEEELRLFLRSWELAQSSAEQAISAEEIGIMLNRMGDNAQAKCWLQRARAGFTDIRRAGMGGAEAHLGNADMLLGAIARDAGDYPAAEAFLRSALSERPAQDQMTASTQNALADLLREQGRAREAAALFTSVLSMRGITSHQRMDALLGVADADRALGAWPSSAAKWNAAIEVARGEGDRLAEAIALRGLGSTWLEAGVPARAEPLLRDALSLLKGNPSAPGEQIAAVLVNLGDLHRGENKLALAEEAYLEALKLDRRLLGEDHPQTGKLFEDLSIVYALRGDFRTARDLSAQAASLMSRGLGPSSLAVAATLSTQAFVEMRAKDPAAAAEFYRQALEIARRNPDNQRLELSLIERYSAVMQMLHRGREVEGLKSEAKALNTYFKTSQFKAAQLH